MKGSTVYLTTRQLIKLTSLLLIAVILIGGMLIFFNFNKTSIEDELVTLDLLPKPEKLTELYFDQNANLPTSARSNQAISFTFVIHNLETTDFQYVYDVVVKANGTKHIVDSGSVLVKNNQYYVKNEKFNLMNSPGRQQVVVELTNKQQSIDFWMKGITK
jgi:hypothetical protein